MGKTIESKNKALVLEALDTLFAGVITLLPRSFGHPGSHQEPSAAPQI